MRDKLINSTIFLWTMPGSSEPSLRAILDHSGAAAPSLYHHFESIYHLYRSAHDVAAGRADLFFECKLCPWDYAAGGLIVTEAGGIATQLDGIAHVAVALEADALDHPAVLHVKTKDDASRRHAASACSRVKRPS